MQGFEKFLMQGDLIIIAVGLVVALAFSTLIKAFTDNVITPLVNAAEGGKSADSRSASPSMVSELTLEHSSLRSSTSSSSWQ